MAKRPTHTQRRILANALAGRRLDDGRAGTQSAAAGWGCSISSCVRAGWLDQWTNKLTDAGRAIVEVEPAGPG